MDEKKLWVKISGSINHYLRYYDKRMSDEELLEDYVFNLKRKKCNNVFSIFYVIAVRSTYKEPCIQFLSFLVSYSPTKISSCKNQKKVTSDTQKKYIVNPIHLSLHSESKMLYPNKTTSPNPRKKHHQVKKK